MLEDSIKEEGCREPIIVWKDIIIDGHNRYDICKKLYIPFNTLSKEFSNEAEAIVWIIKNQLMKNSNEYQRVLLILELENFITGMDKRILEELAEYVDVPYEIMIKVDKIDKKATKKQKKRFEIACHSNDDNTINQIYNEILEKEKKKPTYRYVEMDWDDIITEYEVLKSLKQDNKDQNNKERDFSDLFSWLI